MSTPTTALPDAKANKNLEGPGIRARVQKFGGYLAGMIMPNIGAFIAWGLITALFIPTGWTPNEGLASLVGPMIIYLLPLLIGYTGGRMVHGQRGAVIGAIATMGVIVGVDIPMFLGAMIMGPLAAYILKLADSAIEGKVPAGFEMLIDNFSLGILGMGMAILGKLAIGPVVTTLVNWLGDGVDTLVNAGLLPLASIFVEPAKVLFLNNAINHGVLSPLGIAESADTGRSILFMVESNPGPGLGILLAYALFGPRMLRASTPGAIIIHFLGGIHEIYFPYVLMKPKMILAAIAGGMSALFIGTALNAGLVAPASPGSIFAYLAVTPRGGYLAMFATVATGAVVSFVVGSFLLGFGRGEKKLLAEEEPAELPSDVNVHAGAGPVVSGSDVTELIIACDAGMGSSVMVASTMRKRLSPYGVEVRHTPVAGIPDSAQIVLTHEGLVDQARKKNPNAVVVPFSQYMGDPAFDRVEQAIKNNMSLSATGATAAAAPATPAAAGTTTPAAAPSSAAPAAAPAAAPTRPRRKKRLERGVMSPEGVKLGLASVSKDEAIRQSGDLLVALGAATPEYTDGMFAREVQTSTFLGNGVAIPHGTNESREHITKAALGFLQFPDGIDWDGNTAHVVIPIASNSNEHVAILGALATALADPAKAERLRTTTSVDEVLDILTPEEE